MRRCDGAISTPLPTSPLIDGLVAQRNLQRMKGSTVGLVDRLGIESRGNKLEGNCW